MSIEEVSEIGQCIAIVTGIVALIVGLIIVSTSDRPDRLPDRCIDGVLYKHVIDGDIKWIQVGDTPRACIEE